MLPNNKRPRINNVRYVSIKIFDILKVNIKSLWKKFGDYGYRDVRAKCLHYSGPLYSIDNCI